MWCLQRPSQRNGIEVGHVIREKLVVLNEDKNDDDNNGVRGWIPALILVWSAVWPGQITQSLWAHILLSEIKIFSTWFSCGAKMSVKVLCEVFISYIQNASSTLEGVCHLYYPRSFTYMLPSLFPHQPSPICPYPLWSYVFISAWGMQSCINVICPPFSF